jgi:hypothetical protein
MSLDESKKLEPVINYEKDACASGIQAHLPAQGFDIG